MSSLGGSGLQLPPPPALSPSAAAAAYLPQVRIATASPFYFGTKAHATRAITVVGFDATDSVLFGKDTTNGALYVSSDWGVTWVSRTLPTDVTYANIGKIVRAGAYLYLLARATTGSVVGVYRTLPGASYTWSAALTTFPSGTAVFPTVQAADASYIYVGTYGDPVGGPLIQRTAVSDGATWTTVYAADATLRHCHTVAPDPYNPGHVWAVFGDGTAKTIQKSTDYGATWAVVIASSAWQGVQVSFGPSWVWLAGDSMRGTVYVIDRATNTPYVASSNYHHSIAVPGGNPARSFTDMVTTNGSATVTSAAGAAFVSTDVGRYIVGAGIPSNAYVSAVNSATSITISQAATATSAGTSGTLRGDMFYANAYYGAVDPATGVYYCAAADTSNVGNSGGMFVLSKVGGRVELLDHGILGSQYAEVFIAGAYVFSGQWRFPLFTLA